MTSCLSPGCRYSYSSSVRAESPRGGLRKSVVCGRTGGDDRGRILPTAALYRSCPGGMARSSKGRTLRHTNIRVIIQEKLDASTTQIGYFNPFEAFTNFYRNNNTVVIQSYTRGNPFTNHVPTPPRLAASPLLALPSLIHSLQKPSVAFVNNSCVHTV